MPVIEPTRALAKRTPTRRYVPTRHCGNYRLPPSLIDILGSRLRSFRNAHSANLLATFLARMNAGPKRFGRSFPIDRRALANHPDLGLSEDRIRGAIATLEKVGFIERVPMKRTYRQHEDGVRRKAIQWRFGPEFNGRFAFLVAKRRLVKSPEGRGMVKKDLVEARAIALPLGEKDAKTVANSTRRSSHEVRKGSVNGRMPLRGSEKAVGGYEAQSGYRASHRPHEAPELPDGRVLPLWSDSKLEDALARFAAVRRTTP